VVEHLNQTVPHNQAALKSLLPSAGGNVASSETQQARYQKNAHDV
jgi:hypothetical protein